MENRTKLEIKRQLFHIFFGILILVLINFDVLTPLILLIFIIIGIFISLISKKFKIPLIYWFLQNFEREENIRKFPGRGVIYYLIGSLIVVGFFRKDVALASIAILALGDSISHLVGRFKGAIKHPFTDKKFLEGALAGMIAAFVGSVLFVPPIEAAIASIFAMMAEGLDIGIGLRKVDDNIIVPVVAAISVWLFRLFFI
ncbi:hypothetical protein J4209_03845 [Candidatus Woesearchaeota archaeon]|nr:hypothetical protein [Candidatus Woesearchaeota archaeon]